MQAQIRGDLLIGDRRRDQVDTLAQLADALLLALDQLLVLDLEVLQLLDFGLPRTRTNATDPLEL